MGEEKKHRGTVAVGREDKTHIDERQLLVSLPVLGERVAGK